MCFFRGCHLIMHTQGFFQQRHAVIHKPCVCLRGDGSALRRVRRAAQPSPGNFRASSSPQEEPCAWWVFSRPPSPPIPPAPGDHPCCSVSTDLPVLDARRGRRRACAVFAPGCSCGAVSSRPVQPGTRQLFMAFIAGWWIVHRKKEHVSKPIHPLIDIWVVSMFWLLGAMLWWTLLCTPVWTGAFVLLDVCLREGWPGYVVTLCLIVWGIARLFFKATAPFCIPT